MGPAKRAPDARPPRHGIEEGARTRPATGALRPPWSRSDRRIPRTLVQPLVSFVDTEASSGVLLVASATIALVVANSPWSVGYERLWHTDLGVRLGSLSLQGDLREWVNEGLMTLFFFVVGIEIKRELVVGELRSVRAAAFPIVAAIGGMVVPALIYLAANPAPPEARGWAIPVATDIAFAVGILALFGRRLPPGVRLFVLALAIVDDIGAVLIITLFYSRDLDPWWVAAALALIGAVVVLRRMGVRAVPVYVVVAAGLWLALRGAGINPTIAGIALGLLTPVVPFQPPAHVSSEARRVADETVDDPRPPDADAPSWLYLTQLAREAAPPSARFESALHPWTSLLVLPLFALANAGVDLRVALRGGIGGVAVGVAVGLVLGKGLGILVAAALATKLRIAAPPDGVGWGQVAGAAAVAGVGFTVSLFVAGLAFRDPALLGQAKVGILSGSAMAASVGAIILWRTCRSGASTLGPGGGSASRPADRRSG